VPHRAADVCAPSADPLSQLLHWLDFGGVARENARNAGWLSDHPGSVNPPNVDAGRHWVVDPNIDDAFGRHPSGLANKDEIMTRSLLVGVDDIPVYVSVGSLAGCVGPLGVASMGVNLGQRWCVSNDDCPDDDTCFKPTEVHGGPEIVGVLPGYCSARAIVPGGGGGGGGGGQAPSGDSGLSGGAIAGIAVGGTVVAAGFAYVGFRVCNGQKKENFMLV